MIDLERLHYIQNHSDDSEQSHGNFEIDIKSVLTVTWRRQRHAGIHVDRAGLVVGVRVGGQVELYTVLNELLLYQSLRT